MFLRFVTAQIDEDSRKPKGVFTVAYSLLESGELNSDDWKRVRAILNWFNEHLPHPPDKFDASRAVFWFKSDSKTSISQIWELVQLLREHGRDVQIQKCPHLANVCYEDQFQIAAYPSEQDGRVTT